MTVAIMQPYFLPYIGYWQLIANSDQFIFFDVVQYNKRSWMNRNRILHPDQPDGFQYITIPMQKHSHGTLIKDVCIQNEENWKEKILGQLTVYQKLKAPFYDEVMKLLKKVFEAENEKFLDLIINSTKEICNYIGIKLTYDVASNIAFNKDQIQEAGDWALELSKTLDATHYINPYGGYALFDEDKYNLNGIDIKFIRSNLTPYKQSWRKTFQSGLSIIDVLMFNDKESAREILKNDFCLLSKKTLEQMEII